MNAVPNFLVFKVMIFLFLMGKLLNFIFSSLLL